MASFIAVRVNGDEREIPAGWTVGDLLSDLSISTDGSAVERNKSIVPRSRHGEEVLEDGDVIEIVTFVGGG